MRILLMFFVVNGSKRRIAIFTLVLYNVVVFVKSTHFTRESNNPTFPAKYALQILLRLHYDPLHELGTVSVQYGSHKMMPELWQKYKFKLKVRFIYSPSTSAL